MTEAITPSKRQAEDDPPESRPNILLAVTGSVAAIKCPELAVRLVRECDANVKVLLSQGGKNFWEKSRGYNPQYWDQLMEEVQQPQNARISIIGR